MHEGGGSSGVGKGKRIDGLRKIAPNDEGQEQIQRTKRVVNSACMISILG